MRWLLALIALPQADLQLTAQSISGPTGFTSLYYEWRFHPGDDPAWAAPDFDDSSWRRSNPSLELDEELPPGWQGIGWYRTKIDVAPELAGVPLGMWLRLLGACEIYVDGRLVEQRGQIAGGRAQQPEPHIADPLAPQMLTFDRAGLHTIAVRHASQAREYEPYLSFFRGFEIALGDYHRAVDYRTKFLVEYHGIHKLFIGAALTLAILHMLIFIFTRRYPENFYFALATLCVTGIAHYSRMWSYCETNDSAVFGTTMFKISLFCTLVFSIAFYYQVFLERLPRAFWGVAAAGAILCASAYFLPMRLVFLIAVVAFLEPARMLIKALLHRMEDAWIIVIGGAASTGSAIAQMLPLVLGDEDTGPPMPIYLYGFLLLLLTMSIYLARRFARMNVRLREQLQQVQQLSELTLEQERENARKEAELE